METSQRQALRAKAHHLKPVVFIGAKGLTEAVLEESNQALLAHELIKIKIANTEKELRQIMAQELSEKLEAHLVQMIGNIVVLYRKNLDK